MFQKHSPRPIIAPEHRMMFHAFVASWGCQDPYIQSGAVLAIKESIRASACSAIVGDVYGISSKIHWDDPCIYNCVAHSEMRVLDFCDKSILFDAAIYVSVVPHPDSVKNIIDRGIKNIVYFPHKPAYVPKDYEKRFARLISLYHSIKIERYNHSFYWLMDKINLVKSQIPNFLQ